MQTEKINTERILDLLEGHTGPVQALYLFGSFGSAVQDANSDMDLAVLPERALSDRQRWAASQELAAELGRDVDLIDLRAASTVLRSQILTSGRNLYRRPHDPSVEAFEDFVYADYARLNEARAGILADIQSHGTVYGG